MWQVATAAPLVKSRRQWGEAKAIVETVISCPILLEIFLTDTGDAKNRFTVAVSSAGLLRVYDQGVSLSNSDSVLASNNLYFHKLVSNFDYRVITRGTVNGGVCTGLDFEVYIPFEDLGLDGDALKLCFKYSNVTGTINGGVVTKTETPEYLIASSRSQSEAAEESIAHYFSLADLISF